MVAVNAAKAHSSVLRTSQTRTPDTGSSLPVTDRARIDANPNIDNPALRREAISSPVDTSELLKGRPMHAQLAAPNTTKDFASAQTGPTASEGVKAGQLAAQNARSERRPNDDVTVAGTARPNPGEGLVGFANRHRGDTELNAWMKHFKQVNPGYDASKGLSKDADYNLPGGFPDRLNPITDPGINDGSVRGTRDPTLGWNPTAPFPSEGKTAPPRGPDGIGTLDSSWLKRGIPMHE